MEILLDMNSQGLIEMLICASENILDVKSDIFLPT